MDFWSETEPDEAFLRLYARTSLPLQTWPFLRTLIADLCHRMGWQPPTLPLLKLLPPRRGSANV
ncbi:MAG: hypothetical protein RMK01_09880 [Thermomicrobium sp.]|nr:hypothetical protein [Thermomicrobium sp.]MDW8060370.1 hypothetical protein [Thermomicrobium sp.]